MSNPVKPDVAVPSGAVNNSGLKNPAHNSVRKMRWPGWLAVFAVLLTGMACRLEFGVGPEVSPPVEQSAAATLNGQQPAVVAPANRQPAVPQNAHPDNPVQETAATEPTVLPPASPPAAQVTPTISPLPTSTSTAGDAKLVPTVTSKNEAALSSGTTLIVAATPTVVPLIPSRYPPTRIIAPAIKLDAPVESTGWSTIEQNGDLLSVWNIPEFAAGWHQNSALPGQGSNVVFSGHHNIGGEVFRDLVDLKVGDEITVQADAYEYHYKITDRFIVPERDASVEQRAQNAQWIQPTVDERITLVTCWPYNNNTHRLIVVAKPLGFNKM